MPEEIAARQNLKLIVKCKIAREKVEKLIHLSPRDEGMFDNAPVDKKARWARGVAP
ncbi:hypothetical protein ACFLXE_07660 [Chloroflexota bacterium]